ncbi:16S rRNA (uracil1498-N3)-methyltransferase [Meinhardsimonia xiamenensis]|jgi:16S rRNA (uracil1498-N3)-methyltransferase|uniref:Ribosomal RNA small subunit methyltransferase E n=1 Tax=Meinhardsimonia xiamenensis TaxID=990712 RepID=A0A1G9ACU4_9RHOB|nr:16S rRNA (uracil(1498)-N(3))-methyltransferase [Meinhardsimonia xiamenensis]PRX35457.1 16S rRNA (uracil1498-N3)-methyltransferase [Meinhardsimonia xiamenensis]SDK24644.1 16S rRNA (uracil1498-N3)-methyltransferase [Meinhardsimonia xiamenensis]
MTEARIRLHVDHPLAAGQSVSLTREQAHYLFNVMRLGPGARVLLINSRDGEWLAEVLEAGKRAGRLAVLEQTRPLQPPPDLWLLFAPIKKARTDFIVEKAAEMGAARILPVQTEFTNAERIRRDRLQAHAVEAIEQCGGTYVPPVEELQPLDRLLAGWTPERRIMFADESLVGARAALEGAAPGPWAILIGPEGGFSPAERARLRSLDFVVPVSLGPRILRADTAAVAAMTVWQMTLGDWR